jgi:hypothetical protein
MHRAIAERLRADPGLIELARRRTAAWRASGEVHSEYVEAWERLLGLPLEDVCARIVDPGEQARALRQVSPFAGVLSARERWSILQGVP